MADGKSGNDAGDGSQPKEKCSVLAPLTGVRLAWALTGGFNKPDVAVADKYEAETADGKKISIAEHVNDDKDILRSSTDKVAEMIECYSKSSDSGSAEEKYAHESTAAIRAAVRNLATIYRSRDLNFKENDALRDVYMTSIKEGIAFGASLRDFAKSLPGLVIAAGSGLVFSLISIYLFNVQITLGNVFVFSVVVAIVGIFFYWITLILYRWWQKRIYIRSDHERALYYIHYLERSKNELKELYRELDELHKTFCKNKVKDILGSVRNLVRSLELYGGTESENYQQIYTTIDEFKDTDSQKKLLDELLALRQIIIKNTPQKNPCPVKVTETDKVTESTKVFEAGIETEHKTEKEFLRTTDNAKVSGTAVDLDSVIDQVREIDSYFCAAKDSNTPDQEISNMLQSLYPTECGDVDTCLYHWRFDPKSWVRCETWGVRKIHGDVKPDCSDKKRIFSWSPAIYAIAAFFLIMVIASVFFSLVPQAPSGVILTKDPGTMPIDSSNTFNVTVVLNNAGNTAISDIFMEDTIPPAFQYVSGDLTGSVPTLAPHSQATLHYTLRSLYAGTFPASPAHAFYMDSVGRLRENVSNVPTYEVRTTGPDSGTVRVYKSVSPAVIAENQSSTVKVTVENAGTGNITNLTISDARIPEGFAFGEGNTTLTIPFLKASESRSLHYTLQSVNTGRYILDPATAEFETDQGNHTRLVSNSPVTEVIAGFSRPDSQMVSSPDLPEYNTTEILQELKNIIAASKNKTEE